MTQNEMTQIVTNDMQASLKLRQQRVEDAINHSEIHCKLTACESEYYGKSNNGSGKINPVCRCVSSLSTRVVIVDTCQRVDITCEYLSAGRCCAIDLLGFRRLNLF